MDHASFFSEATLIEIGGIHYEDYVKRFLKNSFESFQNWTLQYINYSWVSSILTIDISILF